MKKGIITMSFDDGHEDNYNIAEKLLLSNSIPATMNIITGYIDDEKHLNLEGFLTMNKKQLIELSQSGIVEIAGHSHTHCNDLQDIIKGREKLIEWLGLSKAHMLGFASPGSRMTIDYIAEHMDFFRLNGFLYVRTGLNIHSWRYLRLLSRKTSRILHNGFLYKTAYKDTFQDSVSNMTLLSVPVLFDTRFNELKAVIDYAIKEKKYLTLLFHSILKKDDKMYGNPWGYDYYKFKRLIEYLKSKQYDGELDIMTSRDAYNLLSKK